MSRVIQDDEDDYETDDDFVDQTPSENGAHLSEEQVDDIIKIVNTSLSADTSLFADTSLSPKSLTWEEIATEATSAIDSICNIVFDEIVPRPSPSNISSAPSLSDLVHGDSLSSGTFALESACTRRFLTSSPNRTSAQHYRSGPPKHRRHPLPVQSLPDQKRLPDRAPQDS